MSDAKSSRISEALAALARAVDELQDAGSGIPAVERNAVRLRGTLRALEVQFTDLPDVLARGEA